MKAFHEGDLVSVAQDGDDVDGIVVHVPSLVKVEVVVTDPEHGPVFRMLHPKVVRGREAAGEHDEALRQAIRRTRSSARGRGGGGGAGGRGRPGHSSPAGHRTTGK